MAKEKIDPSAHYEKVLETLTRQGLLLGSYDAAGKANLMTIGWGAMGRIWGVPAWVVLVRPSRYTWRCIEHSGCFSVNVPTTEMHMVCATCGSVSGRDTDKFAACGFHAVPGARVAAPLIEECPINIECVTRHRLSLGAHDLFIGEILAVHFDEDVLDSRGRLQPAKVDPLAYVHGDFWSLGEKVGSYGFTLKQPHGEAKG